VVHLFLSTVPAFFPRGKLFGLALPLLRTQGSPALVRSIVNRLAGQTGRADPSTALAAPAGFHAGAGLALEGVMTARTDDRYDSFQNIEIIDRRDVPHGLPRDRDAILEYLSRAAHTQQCATRCKAALDLRDALYAPFITRRLVPNESPVLQLCFGQRF